MKITLNFNPRQELLTEIFLNFNHLALASQDDDFLCWATEYDRFSTTWKYVVVEADCQPIFVIIFPKDQSYFDDEETSMYESNSSSSEEVKAYNILSNMYDCFRTSDPVFLGSDYYHDMCRLLLLQGGLDKLSDVINILYNKYLGANYDFIEYCESILDDPYDSES